MSTTGADVGTLIPGPERMERTERQTGAAAVLLLPATALLLSVTRDESGGEERWMWQVR